MRQRKIFVATGILVFDFELFIGELRQEKKGWQYLGLPALGLYWAFGFVSRASCPRFEGETLSTHGLLCQGLHLLWAYCSVIDADVVDQAGPEGPRSQRLAQPM
jgi:hypothetical protein